MMSEEHYSSGEDEDETFDEDEEINIDNIEDAEFVPGHEFFHDDNFYPSIKEFTGSPSCISDAANLNGHEPIHYLDLFLSDNLLDLIVRETNLYQQQNPEPLRLHMKPWQDLTKDELKKFLGLTMLMGHVRKVKLDDYWSTNPLLVTPIFRQTMTRNRYEQILKFLHFQDNQQYLNHPLKKIKIVINDLNEKFSLFLNPGKNLCIDESLLLWKGRLKFKQFLPLKRDRFGIKLFQLVDCTSGFILGFIVYTGADTDYKKFDLGITGDVVAHFLEPYFGKGHAVYVDNWYSSPKLVEFLHEKDTGLCGTVRKNRAGLPELTKKLQKGETQSVHNMIWLALKWQDKKEVWMITSINELGYASTGKKHYLTGEEKMKPNCIIDYNKNMGGVDNVDRQLALAQSIRKSLKWYRKLFFHLVDLSLINAHALFKLHGNRISFTDFRMRVISHLVIGNTYTSGVAIQPGLLTRLSGQHFIRRYENNSRRRCTLCSLRHKTSQTRYHCPKCEVPLCLEDCFEEYHTKEDLV